MKVLLFHINMQLLPWNLLSASAVSHESYNQLVFEKKIHCFPFTIKKTPKLMKIAAPGSHRWASNNTSYMITIFGAGKSQLNPKVLSHFYSVFNKNSYKINPKRAQGRMKQNEQKESTLVRFQESEKYRVGNWSSNHSINSFSDFNCELN